MISKEQTDPYFSELIEALFPVDLEKGPWIAGGCARKLWFGEEWKNGDIDLFFPSIDVFDLYSRIMDAKPPFSINGMMLKPRLHIVTSRAKTYVIEEDHGKANESIYDLVPKKATTTPKMVVQLIKRKFHADLGGVFSDFDFTVCKFATNGKRIIAEPDAIRDCERKLLIFNRSDDDRTSKLSPKRVMKYSVLYGFEATNPVMKEMMRQRETGEIHNADDDYA